MARTKTKKKVIEKQRESFWETMDPRTRGGILGVVFFVLAIFFVIASIKKAGLVGGWIFSFFTMLLGVGYYLIPIVLILIAIAFVKPSTQNPGKLQIAMAIIFFFSSLSLIGIFNSAEGGVMGGGIAHLSLRLFDYWGSIIILSSIMIISVIIVLETKIDIEDLFFWRQNKDNLIPASISGNDRDIANNSPMNTDDEKTSAFSMGGFLAKSEAPNEPLKKLNLRPSTAPSNKIYIPPPITLLGTDQGKPGVGDIKANANLIKRTLENFGIDVAMDEISIGPTVTRYSLKPAAGVRLSKIVGLQNNLELALAAHPARIEAPIPGKSLVGIKVPNTTKSVVGLGGLLSDDEYQKSPHPLMVSLGKGISGRSHFTNLAKMPHMLIAGATGSGKSVTIHTLINSLLYRNSPEQLKLIMIDPKRVELTLYNGIPHLLTPVLTNPKKAILALKWAAREMDRRYDILESSKVRDIESYHKNILGPALDKIKSDGHKEGEEIPYKMPYIVIVIDELADIMQAYPRELESAIVRLAQMSRAVGIHLVLSTQRPSVNVITGLIKANIPARIAMQVASQIDSRTILDTIGAEKLLGAGDMLFLSGEMSKPIRLQSAFMAEKEVKSIVKYLQKEYENELPDEVDIATEGEKSNLFEVDLENDDNDVDEDSMYEEARETVMRAGKASTSYLQRKLRVGYARAARLMDMLEENGVIGPSQGSKPRDVTNGSGNEKSEYGAVDSNEF